jgi:hypothetical protein
LFPFAKVLFLGFDSLLGKRRRVHTVVQNQNYELPISSSSGTVYDDRFPTRDYVTSSDQLKDALRLE